MESLLSNIDYVVVLILIAICDGLWLSLNINAYNRGTRAVQGSDITMNPYGAFLSYGCLYALLILYAVPMVLHVIQMQKASLWNAKLRIAIQYGGLLGLLVYGVYNFTCLAILQHYPLDVAIRDTLWGGILFTVICMAVAMIH